MLLKTKAFNNKSDAANLMYSWLWLKNALEKKNLVYFNTV